MSSDPIPLAVPVLQGKEWTYIKECLDTNWVSAIGPFVEKFERTVAERLKAGQAVATVNGTAALHTALIVTGIRPNDEVLVSTLTFIAPANAIRYCGAWPVFIDAESTYWQMDPERVKDFLDKQCQVKNGGLANKKTGRRVRAILPVHILGHPVDMDPLLEMARRYDLTIIEDATECLGAKYKGRNVGTLGDLGCFSFNGNKIITTGGGGMIVTQNPAWADRARYLTTQAKDDPVEYIHQEIGYNYRLTNLQAAIGCAQMEELDSFIDSKRRIASTYAQGLEGLPGVQFMREASEAFSIYWLYTILIRKESGRGSRDLLKSLGEMGIQSRPLWKPLHRSPAHQGSQVVGGEVADRLSEEALSLPSSSNLSAEDQERVIQSVCSFLS